MPKTASASVMPWTCAMPQSSRVIVTFCACAFQRANSGGDAAVRMKRSGRSAAVVVLRIRQCLLGLAPACKRLRRSALQQLIRVADAEMVSTLVLIEFVPCDRRGDRRSFAAARGVRHDRRRPALVAQPVEEDAALALNLADVGGEHLRLGLGDRTAEALGEILDRVPVLRRVERDDDVDSLSA